MMMRSGFVGRTTIDVYGAVNLSDILIPCGSLVQVTRKSYEDGDSGLGTRWNIVLLDKRGRIDDRDISYDGAWEGMMVPEPGIILWTPEDSAAAIMQGWDIFFCDRVNEKTGEVFELQAVNDANRFNGDREAWEFVWKGAVECDDPLCQRALAFLRYRVPGEYKAIRRTMLYPAKPEGRTARGGIRG